MVKKNLFFIVIFVAFASLVYLFMFSNKKKVRAKVNSIEKVESTHGDKDMITTDVYYLVLTDRGTFRISISGFFAHPNLAGKVEKDSTYTFDICGVEVPFLGMYRNVTDIR